MVPELKHHSLLLGQGILKLRPLSAAEVIGKSVDVIKGRRLRLLILTQNEPVALDNGGGRGIAVRIGSQHPEKRILTQEAHHHAADLSLVIDRRIAADEPLAGDTGGKHGTHAGSSLHTPLKISPVPNISGVAVAGVVGAVSVYKANPVEAGVGFHLCQQLQIGFRGGDDQPVQVRHGGDGALVVFQNV